MDDAVSPVTRPRFDAAAVRRYYDRHTAAFLRFGQGGGEGAIHRAVRLPGRTREQAFHHAEDQIAALARGIAGAPVPHLLDLGCGVGASLCYIARQHPIRGTGVTLSPLQARMARQRVREAGLESSIECIEGDYTALPPRIRGVDLAYAIESFVHGPSPERFFAECARVVKPGGLLVICDDFRRPVPDPGAARTLARFCRGWHVNSLVTAGELQSAASAAGFTHVSTDDLTSAVEMHRWRDRVIDVLGAMAGWLPYGNSRFAYLFGGSALQRGLARGWIAYELAVFRRNVTATG